MLAIIETHPIQYHAPVWRALNQDYGIPVTAIYGSDFSIQGYHDSEFDTAFRWDTDLLSGYSQKFLSRIASGGARNADEVTVHGLSEELKNPRYKAVMCVGYSPRFHWDGFACAKKSRLPILFRGETTDHAVKRNIIKKITRYLALRWFYSHCKALIHVGKRSLEHFKKMGFPAAENYYSPYCVDISPFRVDEADRSELRNSTRQALGVREGQKAILFCGKLSFRKGPDILLAAIKQLPERLRKECFLLLVGDGELKSELLKGTSDIPVKCVGFQAQKDLSKYYHASDLFVLPSRLGETWGLVVNEALHHGLPAVVTEAVGCSPDLVEQGKTGATCAVNSIAALADAMTAAWPLINSSVVRDQCRKKMEEYTVGKAAAGIAAAYNRAVLGAG